MSWLTITTNRLPGRISSEFGIDRPARIFLSRLTELPAERCSGDLLGIVVLAVHGLRLRELHAGRPDMRVQGSRKPA
jgi:hypothetical protein